MRLKRKDKITITVDTAEFLNRLFAHSHLVEKLCVVAAVAIFGVMVGIFIGRQSTTAGWLEAPPSYSPSNVSFEPPTYQKPADPSSEMRNPSSITPEPFFFSIRVSSSDSQQDADVEAKKFKSKCGVSFVRYSSVHQKHLVYCGRFDDLSSAEKTSAELGDVRQVLVRLYPNE